ncbi:hypothetical protein PMIN03_008872 [Paraphaeosphaeria minitans]
MRLRKVPYLRAISRKPGSSKKLGERVPHGVVVGGASPSTPAAAAESTSITMSDHAHDQNTQSHAPDDGHDPSSLPPPAKALPPHPSLPTWTEGVVNVADNGLTEEGRRAEAYHQANAHRQPRPATGQLPNQPTFFNGNFPLSNVPSGGPLVAASFASTQSALSYGGHSFSRWFTGQGRFNNNLPPVPPPPPPFEDDLPPFFTAGFPLPFPVRPLPQPQVTGTAVSETAHPFGQTPHSPAGTRRFAQASSNMPQSQVTASDTPNDTGVSTGPKERKKDPKIYLAAPIPTPKYLMQASLQAEVRTPPSRKLVILDLNGTLIYRPNSRKQPRKMIARPFLQQFLAYLFDNFAVMVWSSAKPENVSVLVEIGLDGYRHRLIACWGRDTLGLDPKHYSMNVQCYKNLTRIWASKEIQRPEAGGRFDQRNTILIDDSSLKAAAQPHNLLEIPEFKGVEADTPVQDVLAEVVGYLEVLKMQEDVSKFIHKDPFRANGDWRIEWNELALHSLRNHLSWVSSPR